MTRQEAIEDLSVLFERMDSKYNVIPVNDISIEAVDMAIEALRQEPCEDAVSRQALLDKLDEWDWQELYLPIHFKELIIDDLPSVKPAERVGR